MAFLTLSGASLLRYAAALARNLFLLLCWNLSVDNNFV